MDVPVQQLMEDRCRDTRVVVMIAVVFLFCPLAAAHRQWASLRVSWQGTDIKALDVPAIDVTVQAADRGVASDRPAAELFATRMRAGGDGDVPVAVNAPRALPNGIVRHWQRNLGRQTPRRAEPWKG